MLQFFLASWRAGFRSRALLGFFLLGLVLVFFAYLTASFSMRQLRTVTLDVGLSGLRFCLVFISITLVQDLVGREIERRSVVFSLSYPSSRASYLFGRFLGVIALSGVAATILGLLLWMAVMLAGGSFEQEHRVVLGSAYWITVGGVWLDSVVVTSFVLLVCSIATTSLLPLAAGIAFALAGKAFGPLLEYIARGADGQEDMVAVYQPLLAIAQWLIPDLSRLDWRFWPMYGVAPEMSTVALAILMAFLYSAALLAFSAWLFSRREFS
jgi:ABC-type transport system involved in multi-copper enzyme maturation permease subunit